MEQHEHDFQEEYYSYKCRLCGLFYAFGQAPWEYDFENEEPFTWDDAPEWREV